MAQVNAPTFWLALLLSLGACDDDSSSADPEPDGAVPDAAADAALPDMAAPDAFVDPWCPGPVEQRYDPLVAGELELFPDDLLTREDPDSPTGIRLDVNVDNAPWVAGVPNLLKVAVGDLAVLSGFGTHAGIVMRFTDLVAPTEANVVLYDLGQDPPEPVAVELDALEGGAGLVVQPLRPLRPGTRHAVFATALSAAEGGCVRPSPTMQALLTDGLLPEALEPMRARYHEALEATGTEPHAVSAATVFTTNRDLEVLVAAAADVRGREYAWAEPPTCGPPGNRFRLCHGRFEANDYRGEAAYVATAEPNATWTLPVTVWLPIEGEGPFPTIVYGHGIGDSSGSGRHFAERFCPDGYAVVATDAMRHGQHPTADPMDAGGAALSFLGINIQQVRIDALALRGNFNQTNLDRLQLLELIRDAPDIDGDGAADLDIERVAYWGVSLGGMLGSGLLALGDDFGAAILSVAGGGLLLFITESAQVAQLRPVILTLFGGEDVFERMMPVAQTLVDAADPATWGAYVLDDRFGDPDHTPNLLFPVAVEDETVPPASGRALARALRITHIEPVLTSVRLLDVASAPVSDNGAHGTTAGYFQFDRVSAGGGRVTAATHNTTPLSREAELQARHFLDTWLGDGPAEIVDPYAELDTPRLP